MVVMHGVVHSRDSQTGVTQDSKAVISSEADRNCWHWTPGCFDILAENPHHLYSLRVFGIVCRVVSY